MMEKPAIYSYSEEDAHRIYAWARYVSYAEIECEQDNAHEAAEDEPTLGRTLVLMMQFYAALWVAVEGWRASPLSDETVAVAKRSRRALAGGKRGLETPFLWAQDFR